MKSFSFETSGGLFDSRDMNIFINKIERPLLPPITQQALTVGTKAGAYLLQSKMEPRTIRVTITLMSATTERNLREDFRYLAWLLYKDQGEGNLIFSDEPDVFYKATLTGESNFSTLAAMGEGTLEFIIADPFGYAVQGKTYTTTNRKIVVNEGTAQTWPLIRVRPSVDITRINIVNETNDKNISLKGEFAAGTPVVIDNNRNLIYLEPTADSAMHFLEISSRFFPLEVGENSIFSEFNYENQVEIEIVYRERFL
jgi:predicted phage tail component-like protein